MLMALTAPGVAKPFGNADGPQPEPGALLSGATPNMQLGFFLKFEGALPRTIYQFIVLTIAHTTGAGFEWQDHIEHARAAGLPGEVIDCIASARPAALPQPYALVHAILTKTMGWQPVPDDLQARAAAEWGKHGLVEIVVLSGFYQMFAAINQGFGIGAAGDGGRKTD